MIITTSLHGIGMCWVDALTGCQKNGGKGKDPCPDDADLISPLRGSCGQMV